jgi:hypothetical protein
MASSFALACDALVRERDRAFLERVAGDYNLDIKELESKYLESGADVKVPKKYKKREPKSVMVTDETGAPVEKPKKGKAEKQACEGVTAKKEPCKFSALKGECFCKRHLKAAADAASGVEAPEAPKKAPKPKKVKEPKAAEPMHSHPLDKEPEGECVVCETHGNPFKATSNESMFNCEPAKLEARLNAIMEGADDTESESESEAESDDSEHDCDDRAEEECVPVINKAAKSDSELSEEEFEDE